MNKVIINPADEKAVETATAQPHGFVYIDKMLQIKTDGYNIQVTLGWQTPSGTYNPVVTAAMPAPFAKELAAALAEETKKAAGKRKAD
jgi:hypothetical protein